MRFSVFSTVSACLVALAAASSNPITAPLAGAVITAGQAFTVTWTPTDGDIVSLLLREGPDQNNLDTLEIIASNLPNNGAYIWVPTSQLKGDTDYAIQIISANPETVNFSARFKIDSNGPGITSTTLMPTTTRSVSASKTKTAHPTVVSTGSSEATSVDVSGVLAEESKAAETGVASPSSTLTGAAGRTAPSASGLGLTGLVCGLVAAGFSLVVV